MSVYHQMGHDSENLLKDLDLSLYRGAILSPVNDEEFKIAQQINKYNGLGFELIFDPQLYFPKSCRGKLQQWQHYPSDVDSADMSSENWWSDRVEQLFIVTKRLQPAAVCSPAVAPRTFTGRYHSLMVNVAEQLQDRLGPIEVIPTVIVNIRDLAAPEKVLETASIIGRSAAKRLFVAFWADVDPRREIFESEDLSGAMQFIDLLETAGFRVIVGFASSEMILWKHAGATHCATGKFFNTRRFTPSRWDPPSTGGGQLEYWFEEALLAFLREADVLRVRNAKKLSAASLANPFCSRILDKLTAGGTAWLRESWRQYLYWFQAVEQRLREDKVRTVDLLREAANNWTYMESQNLFMEENQNNGHWIARWRQALQRFDAE